MHEIKCQALLDQNGFFNPNLMDEKFKMTIKIVSCVPLSDVQFLESDNPGSTDSEVRKILTLHIPITEYDTLGSESDNELSSKSVKQSKYKSQRGEFAIFKFEGCSFKEFSGENGQGSPSDSP